MPQLDFNIFYGNIYIVEILIIFFYLIIFLKVIPEKTFDLKMEEKYKRWKKEEIEKGEEGKKRGKMVEDYIYENLRKGEKTLLGKKVIKKEVVEKTKKRIEELKNGVYSYISYYKKKELERIKTELLRNVSSFRTI